MYLLECCTCYARVQSAHAAWEHAVDETNDHCKGDTFFPVALVKTRCPRCDSHDVHNVVTTEDESGRTVVVMSCVRNTCWAQWDLDLHPVVK